MCIREMHNSNQLIRNQKFLFAIILLIVRTYSNQNTNDCIDRKLQVFMISIHFL